jgi:transcriptional regulator with XRE-family HTH domain
MKMPEINFDQCKIIRRGPPKNRKLGLATLRASQGLTQGQIAKRAGITQSEISRAELRSDCLVSTLERYAGALGGKILLYVEIDGRRYPVTLK